LRDDFGARTGSARKEGCMTAESLTSREVPNNSRAGLPVPRQVRCTICTVANNSRAGLPVPRQIVVELD
jgi:hypothetical protein